MSDGSAPRFSGSRIAAGFIGNVLEWYDFALYGFFAVTIGKLFFPSDDPTTSLIAAFGAFAGGFAMRPLGAIFFGHIGDRYGRRAMLIVSSLTMALSTFAVGLLPTHAEIGVAAALLLVALRLIQGFSVGGEYVGSGVFLAETAPERHRGLIAGFAATGLFCGTLLGSAAGASIDGWLTEDQIASWGWRLPFLAGLLLGLVALVLRLVVSEPPLPTAPSRAPLAEAVTRHAGGMLYAVAVVMTITAGWYVLVIYLPTWMVEHMNVDHALVLEINAANIAVTILVGLCAAVVSDRIGRKPVLVAISLCLAALTWPLFTLIGRGDADLAMAAQGILMALTGCIAFVLPVTLAEMFPWRVRATAANLSFNVGFAVFGGTAPMVAAWLVARTGGLSALALYLTALALCSVVACLVLTDRRGVDLSP